MEKTQFPQKDCSPIGEVSSQLSQYGYYIMIDNLFYTIDPCDIKSEFSFSKLGTIKYAPVEQEFKVIVYRPNWYYEHSSFFAQPIDIVNHRLTKRIEPKITQIGQHVYQLDFPALNKGDLFVIRDYNNLYAIGIGSISETLVEVFNTTKVAAHAVVDNLLKALKSFPNNIMLQVLKGVWEERLVLEKTTKAWNTVLEHYHKYTESEDWDLKLVYADDVIHEIEYYLSLTENPSQKSAADTIVEEIEGFKANKPKVKELALNINDLADQLQVFAGNSFSLTMVQVGEDFLIRFTGIPNEFDGRVLRHKKEIQNQDMGTYILKTNQVNGGNWNTFNVENDGWGEPCTFVYPPGIDSQIYVQQLENTSRDTPLKLYKDYCKEQSEQQSDLYNRG